MRDCVVLGQCAYTGRFLRALLRAGSAVRAVVLGIGVEHDPFAGLVVEQVPEWLARHRHYLSGWRDEARAMCGEYGVPLIETHDVFSGIPQSDALVVAGLGARVPDAMLTRYGDWALNVHSSALPRYAGPQPEAHAILHGETRHGVTVHTMTSRLDAGPIRYRETFPVAVSDDVLSLECRAADFGGEVMARLLAEEVLPEIEPDGERSYFGWYPREETLDLRRSSISMAKRRLRLRPEGWAYWDDGERRIFPVELAGEGDESRVGIRTLALMEGTLALSHWVETDGCSFRLGGVGAS